MAEARAPTENTENWREMTPAELTKSCVDFRIKEVNGKISSAEISKSFYETYQLNQTARPPNIELGSLDASDWDIAEMEAQQFEDERDEMIELYQDEIDELRDQYSELVGDGDRVKKGDPDLVERYSALERERREKLEELQKARQKTA